MQIVLLSTSNLNNLAYVLLDYEGAPDEAQRLVEHALQKSPKNPNLADTLGMVYLKKKLGDSALHDSPPDALQRSIQTSLASIR